MVNKKFDQEVGRYVSMSERTLREEKKRKFYLESEPALADRLRKALELAGDKYAGDYTIGSMIGLINRYRSAEFGFSFAEAVSAAMWKEVQYSSGVDRSKVEQAIKFLIDYRPKKADWAIAQSVEKKIDAEKRRAEFRQNHKVLAFLAFVMWNIALFAFVYALASAFTDSTYWRMFSSAMIVYINVILTWINPRK